jgi:hypothetical protein
MSAAHTAAFFSIYAERCCSHGLNASAKSIMRSIAVATLGITVAVCMLMYKKQQNVAYLFEKNKLVTFSGILSLIHQFAKI